MCSASREICWAVPGKLQQTRRRVCQQRYLLCCKLRQTRRRVCEQRFHRSAVATLDVPQEQNKEDKKMPLLLNDPQSQVFGDEEESDRCMQPLPSQITLKKNKKKYRNFSNKLFPDPKTSVQTLSYQNT